MSERLRHARIEAGYRSATKAAVALDISQSTYRSHENGQNEFGMPQAKIYARKFKCSPQWLLFGEETSGTVSSAGANQMQTTGHIPEIDAYAGLGGGGTTQELQILTDDGIQVAGEGVAEYWKIPDWILGAAGTSSAFAFALKQRGDSMYPTICDGDVCFYNGRHTVPTPDGLYALLDDFGGIITKRLELIPGGGDGIVGMVRIISDNVNHNAYERHIDDIKVIGQWIGKFTTQ